MSNWPASVAVPRLIKFTDLLNKVYAALRIDRRTGPSDPAVQDFIVEAINRAYAWGYEKNGKHGWPEARIFQEWTVQGHPTVTDAAGNHAPFIPRQYQHSNIATLFDLYLEHPLTVLRPTPVWYKLGSDGYYLMPVPPIDMPSTVWAFYRTDAPIFTAEPYSASVTYQPGESTLWTDGNCYLMIGDTAVLNDPPYNNATPPVLSANWQLSPVLWVLRNITTDGAIALYHRGEEKYQSADVLESACYSEFENQALLINDQMGETVNYLPRPYP